MKMKKKILLDILRILLVALLVWLLCTVYSNYLDRQIEQLYQANKSYVDTINGLEQKDKGTALLEETFQNEPGMLVMGSSELSAPVPENPKKLMPNQYYPHHVSYTGHAYVQNALQGMLLGANDEAVSGADIVIIESIQWFGHENAAGFLSNFSELSFLHFLKNERISEENKIYLCNRFIELQEANKHSLFDELSQRFSEGTSLQFIGRIADKLKNIFPEFVQFQIDYPQTYWLAKLYTASSVQGRVVYYITQPYFAVREDFLELKDKFSTYQYLKSLDGTSGENTVHEIDWDQLYITAEEEGKAACTNNDLFVYDEYYTKYLADKYESLKDYSANETTSGSKEWEDLKFFLRVCKELDIKPYVVIMSTNGLYYDYIGYDIKKRTEYYDTIEQIVNEAGYDTLNLKEWEYEPYFYCDVMHLGWKGWTYVSENIVDHFTE